MSHVSLESPAVKKVLVVAGVLIGAQLTFSAIFGGRASAPVTPTVVPAPAQVNTQPRQAAPAAPEGRLTADMVAALPEDATPAGFVYDASGKRDPFRPFDFAPKEADRADLSPLERYEIGQLKLTAVLDGFDEPTAVVENAAGRGFTVKRGAKIGPNGGVITEILRDKLVIVESTTDFTGVTKTQSIEMLIRTKDQKE